MKRASLLTLTLIGAFSAIQLLPGRLIIRYHQPEADWLGKIKRIRCKKGIKNLQAIARRFDTAAMLILEANNTIAPVPKPGTTITIPSQLLLPDAPRQGDYR